MLGSIIIGSVGIALVVMGYFIWKKEKISLLHDYHYSNVSKEDKKAFCTLAGVGVLSIGVGLLITAIIIGITNSLFSFIAMAIGFAVGLPILIYADRKYNK